MEFFLKFVEVSLIFLVSLLEVLIMQVLVDFKFLFNVDNFLVEFISQILSQLLKLCLSLSLQSSLCECEWLLHLSLFILTLLLSLLNGQCNSLLLGLSCLSLLGDHCILLLLLSSRISFLFLLITRLTVGLILVSGGLFLGLIRCLSHSLSLLCRGSSLLGLFDLQFCFLLLNLCCFFFGSLSFSSKFSLFFSGLFSLLLSKKSLLFFLLLFGLLSCLFDLQILLSLSNVSLELLNWHRVRVYILGCSTGGGSSSSGSNLSLG